jgi:hypothetical protein
LYPDELHLDASLRVTLNDQGRDGWEAVTFLPGTDPVRVLFKRPLVQES